MQWLFKWWTNQIPPLHSILFYNPLYFNFIYALWNISFVRLNSWYHSSRGMLQEMWLQSTGNICRQSHKTTNISILVQNQPFFLFVTTLRSLNISFALFAYMIISYTCEAIRTLLKLIWKKCNGFYNDETPKIINILCFNLIRFVFYCQVYFVTRVFYCERISLAFEGTQREAPGTQGSGTQISFRVAAPQNSSFLRDVIWAGETTRLAEHQGLKKRVRVIYRKDECRSCYSRGRGERRRRSKTCSADCDSARGSQLVFGRR